MSENRKCVNCRHRAIKGASDYCEISGNYMHYSVIWDKWCPHWSALKTERWEKNLEMLKSGALGDVDSPETLLAYWKAQAEAGYPLAEENVRYFEDMVRKETKIPTKEELYEIYKRQGGNKPLEELKSSEWTMLSVIYYLEKSKENENA